VIPTVIPIIGNQMDDLFVRWAGMKLVRKFTPKKILMACEEQVSLRRAGRNLGTRDRLKTGPRVG
jgi:uncharacterized membrane protein YkvA (DUF1232 family)